MTGVRNFIVKKFHKHGCPRSGKPYNNGSLRNFRNESIKTTENHPRKAEHEPLQVARRVHPIA